MKDFLEIIQSSEEEIYSYLNYIEAYKIDGWKKNLFCLNFRLERVKINI